MNLSISPYPRFKAFYPTTGTPLSGGFLYTVQPGTTVQYGFPPAYPQPTYTDSGGLTQNADPVVLDGSGEADVWLSTFTKLVLFDGSGNLVWSKDNVSSSPALTPSSLQWVPQSSQVSFISATQFSVPGNLTGTFPPGTAVQATITGGAIYGIVSASSYGGTPITTTVTVVWFSSQLNSSVTSVATGIISAGYPSALPVAPVVPHTGTYQMLYTDLFQTHVANSVSALTFTLLAANSVPSGSWVIVRNAGAGLLTISGTITGASGITLSQNMFIRLISDGANWFIGEGVPTHGLPVQTHTSSPYTFLITDLYQTHLFNSGSAFGATLLAANAVPSGAWMRIKNVGAGTLTLTGTVDGASSPTMAQYNEKMLFSDGTSWWGKTL